MTVRHQTDHTVLVSAQRFGTQQLHMCSAVQLAVSKCTHIHKHFLCRKTVLHLIIVQPQYSIKTPVQQLLAYRSPLLLLLSCPACYALSLARSQPIRLRKAMISAVSALISSLWDRNVFPKVSRRSCLHARLCLLFRFCMFRMFRHLPAQFSSCKL